MKQKRIALIIGAIVIIMLIIVTIVALTKKKVVPDSIDSTQKDTLAVAQMDDTDTPSLPETEESTDSVTPTPEEAPDIEFPETMEKLLGEWISLDESTTCTIDTNSILIHFLGNEAVPEESRYYEYVLISDTQMSITYAGSAPSVYSFSIWEQDGETYFTSPIKAFASTYVRAGANSPSEPDTDSSEIEIILDSQEIDYTEYNKEFEVIMGELLPGTWKGTYDYWERTDSSYHIFTFSADGTYTYSYEDYTETGTYSFSCDLNNKFSSTMYLVYADGERAFNFNVSKSEPYKMTIEDEDYPTLTKE